MGKQPSSPSILNARIGFHYYPDTLHYRESDLQAWLPELAALGASWLVLRSDLSRAIPEVFLRGLKKAGIEPILQFDLPLGPLPDLKEIGTLLEVYARWGARYPVFFDRPNARSSWPAAGWVQEDLVERFLDRYLPVANLAIGMGLAPVFPPLQPGGSYWDTAFLRSALKAIQRRRQEMLLDNLVLSAYAWTGGHPLDWGKGGPERWPQARPYRSGKNFGAAQHLSAGEETQDHRGFHIFEWYQDVASSILHRPCPVILLQAGLPGDPAGIPGEALQSPAYTTDCTAIARLLDRDSADGGLEPVPPQVIAGNFWLLSAGHSSYYASHAWFSPDGARHELVQIVRDARRERQAKKAAEQRNNEMPGRSIQHYLLLPGFEWGVSDWYLEIIRPFVKKYRPTVGFSVDEAEHAVRVTVVGNSHVFSDEIICRLQKAGCFVEQIKGDGTEIATQLGER